MKKLLLLGGILALLLLSGCSDATELGNRVIIQAAAIDYDGEYQLSALLFSSGGSGGETIDASQENVIKVQGKGDTLAAAVDNVSLIDGKKIYFSETKLLILGKGFEEFDSTAALNTLYHDMRCSLNMPVCYTEKAETLTDLQFTEGITSAEKLYSIIDNAYFLGTSPKTTLLDLLAANAGGKPVLVPSFRIEENGRGMTSSDDNNTAVLSGSRQFKDGLFYGDFDKTETKALMLISGESHKTPLNYFLNGTEHTCEAYGVKIKFETQGNKRIWNISAKFRSRNGGKLSSDERKSALSALSSLIEEVV